jgi:hypothetical protein
MSRVLGVIHTEAALALQMKLQNEPMPEPSPGSPDFAAEWRDRFDAVYRLPAGQVLKYIPPPLPPERDQFVIDRRRQWYAKYSPKAVYEPSKDQALKTGFVLRTDGRVPDDLDDFNFMQAGPNWSWNNTPVKPIGLTRYLQMFRMQGGQLRSTPPRYIVVPPELETIDLAGDWLLRPGATQEQAFAALTDVVAQQTGRHVELTKTQIEQDVIVAHGRYQFHRDQPGDEDGVILLYSISRKSKLNTRPQNNTIARLIDGFSDATGVRFVDESESSNERIKTLLYGSYDVRYIKDTGQAMEAFLNNITRQTSLTFAREKRSFEYYAAVEKGGVTQPATMPGVEK